MMRWTVAAAVAAAAIGSVTLSASAVAQDASLRPDQLQFRGLYKELVETNTTLSAGSCTLAAQRMAARLKAAGYRDRDLTLFTAPDHPREGGLVAVLPGSDPAAKPILLLAHLDVVEAKREDWTRDPFAFIEENGFYYGRGVSDDKAQAAIYTDAMIRLHGEKRLRRTVKLALTCGEETTGAFNGADWLAKNKRDLIDAEFALNEGGGGRLDATGKPVALALQVSEKVYQDFTVQATNPGGHSSMPRPDNAIYELAAALGRIQAYKFPVQIDATTRAFWTETAHIVSPSLGQAMTAIAANPQDKLAETLLSRDPTFNSTLRTTCVATLIEGGHAQNALPQRARANVNCRIFPGTPIDSVRVKLVEVIADPAMTVTTKGVDKPLGHPAPLAANVVGPAKALGAEMFPGLPLIPSMSTGASDSIYLAAVGIPSYGVPGILYEADGGGIHGLNEHIRISSIYKGRDYLYRLIHLYADAA